MFLMTYRNHRTGEKFEFIVTAELMDKVSAGNWTECIHAWGHHEVELRLETSPPHIKRRLACARKRRMESAQKHLAVEPAALAKTRKRRRGASLKDVRE